MDIANRLQAGIDQLFVNAGAPASRAVYELKEELLANSMDRYGDMLAKGMGEEEAYNSVMENIGNVEELVAALPQDPLDPALREELEERRAKSALLVAGCVGMYIFIGVLVTAVSLFTTGVWPLVAVLVGLLLCIVPTGLLVYNAYRWPKYRPGDDSIVESFKQYNNNSQRTKGITGALSTMLWCVILIAYFLLSFTSGAWHLTWIIFLVGACLESALVLLVKLRGMK